MSAETKKEIQLEIAHVLFVDVVGYSKCSVNEQRAAIDELNKVVCNSEQFQKAEASDRLIKIPTGDGMALVFYTSPEAPAQCAIDISRAFKENPRVHRRPGDCCEDGGGTAGIRTCLECSWSDRRRFGPQIGRHC